jgi:hypothetical protein
LEDLGIFAAGLYFNEIGRSKKWLAHGHKRVLEEMQCQVAEDGIHASQAMYYHQVCATHFLKFFLLCHRNEIAVPTEFQDRLQKMLESIWWLQKPDGTHPMIGDGAQLVTQAREHWEARALIPVYNRLAGGSVPEPDEAADWFLSKGDSFPGFIPTGKLQRKSKIFPLSGHVVLQDESGHYLFLNCGPLGFEPFPHHGHADALSLEICLNQKTIVMDPGGYAYKNDAIRKFIRGTSAHSTVVVDNRDQSDLYGVFGVGRAAKVRISDAKFSDQLDMVEGIHTGYKPAIHARRVYFIKNGLNSFLIYDFITGSGQHDLKVIYHLEPEVKCQRINSYGYTLFDDSGLLGTCYFFSNKPYSFNKIKSTDISNLRSVICKNTGVAEFSTALEAHAKTCLPISFLTVFSSKKDLNAAIDWDKAYFTLGTNDKRVRIKLNR